MILPPKFSECFIKLPPHSPFFVGLCCRTECKCLPNIYHILCLLQLVLSTLLMPELYFSQGSEFPFLPIKWDLEVSFDTNKNNKLVFYRKINVSKQKEEGTHLTKVRKLEIKSEWVNG